MSFNIALTGLNAATQDLSVTSNNLANVATVGFKGSRAEFGDLFASTQTGVASTAVGNGVPRPGSRPAVQPGQHRDDRQQPRPRDQRQRLLHAEQQRRALATRATASSSSNSTATSSPPQGANLQVYPPLATGGFNTGGLPNLTLTTNESAPQATTTAQITANSAGERRAAGRRRPSTRPIRPATPTRPRSRSMTRWAPPTPRRSTSSRARPPTPGRRSSTSTATPSARRRPCTYSNTGALTAPANGQVTFPAYTPATGAADDEHDLQFQPRPRSTATPSRVTAVQQDGFTTGKLTGINID